MAAKKKRKSKKSTGFANSNITFKTDQKEKREISFIFATVFIVAALGFWLNSPLSISNTQAPSTGLAISLNAESPSYSGILYILEEACFNVESDGTTSCKEICNSNSANCLPLEESCTEITGNFDNCKCCTDISE